MECLGLHNKPKAEVHPGHLLKKKKRKKKKMKKKKTKKTTKNKKKNLIKLGEGMRSYLVNTFPWKWMWTFPSNSCVGWRLDFNKGLHCSLITSSVLTKCHLVLSQIFMI